jgi:predicted transcriptional regulator
MSSSVITARIDPDTLALVDQVAKASGRSRAWFAARAIADAARREAAFLSFVQEGIDAADRGDKVDAAEVDRWFDARIAAHRARCDG